MVSMGQGQAHSPYHMHWREQPLGGVMELQKLNDAPPPSCSQKMPGDKKVDFQQIQIEA